MAKLVLPEVLVRYPALSPRRMVAGSHRPGFSGAGVIRIESAIGPMAVRRWPGGWSPERLRGLHRLLAHIRQRGVELVAVPLRSDKGDTLVDTYGSLWQVEPWLPGVADYHQHPSRARLSAAMSALARWHHAAVGYEPQSAEAAWFAPTTTGPCPAIQERLETLARLSPVLLDDWRIVAECHAPESLRPFVTRLVRGIKPVLSRIDAELRPAAAWSVPLQSCLRDVWHDHVLYTDDVVTGVIDPSAARTDSIAGDLARLLGSLVEDRADEWRFAVEEYRRHRPLSLSEERLIPILDRSGVVLSAVTWLKWLGPEARRWPDTTLIVDRLQRLTARLDALKSGGLMGRND